MEKPHDIEKLTIWRRLAHSFRELGARPDGPLAWGDGI
jgi:hypothetical protein